MILFVEDGQSLFPGTASPLGVTEAEVEYILDHPGEDEPCSGDSRQALGQTADGRYLRVVYVPDEEGPGVFVVTAYPLAGKQFKAFRRRQRRRGR